MCQLFAIFFRCDVKISSDDIASVLAKKHENSKKTFKFKRNVVNSMEQSLEAPKAQDFKTSTDTLDINQLIDEKEKIEQVSLGGKCIGMDC